MRFYLSPDSGGSAPAPSTSSTKKSNIPRKDDDVLSVGNALNTKWAATPGITLVWISQSQFGTMMSNYGSLLGTSQSDGSARPTKTVNLKDVNTTINGAAKKVKTYIDEKCDTKEEAKAMYAQFGFVHRNKAYLFPVDGDKRKDALVLMIAAIAANGFSSKTYGTTFWTNTQTDYNAALLASQGAASTISGDVGPKNQKKKDIQKVMKAILKVIEGNYPDTYKTERRAWGFLRESY